MKESSAIIQSPLPDSVSVGEFSIIRTDVTIGENVVIHPYVIINSGAQISDNVEIFSGAIIGREPKGAGATTRKVSFEKRLLIASNVSIGPHAIIYYDVEVDHNTLIGDGASIREKCRIGSYCIISRYVTLNYNTTIGSHTKIMDQTHITGNSIIGDHVFISTLVGTANDNLGGRKGYQDNLIKGVTIEDGAFIGLGASILPGVKIGKNSIVGANAVVTKDVQPENKVMGIPAKAKEA